MVGKFKKENSTIFNFHDLNNLDKNYTCDNFRTNKRWPHKNDHTLTYSKMGSYFIIINTHSNNLEMSKDKKYLHHLCMVSYKHGKH